MYWIEVDKTQNEDDMTGGSRVHAKPVVGAQATYSLNYVGLDGVLNLFA
jgi:hypothetical protein